MAGPRMSDDEIWAFVTDAHTGIMTTLRRDGMPIALPVWFACVDRQIYVNTRGKKLARIRNDARTSFLVESGLAWSDLRAVHLTGHAEVVALDGDLARLYRDELDRKYASFRTAAADMPAETARAYQSANGGTVRFTPDARVLNWDNRKLVG